MDPIDQIATPGRIRRPWGRGYRLALLCWGWCGLAAAAGPTYSLDDCLRSGLARSSRLANAGRDERIAEARIREVRAQILPDLRLEGEYTRLDEVPAFTIDGQNVPLGRADNYRLSAGLSQLLYSGGSVAAALRAAGAYRVLAQAAQWQARAELARDIRHAFQDVLVADAALEVRRQSVTQLLAWVELVDARFRQGRASAFELQDAHVRLSSEKPLVIQAQGVAELARTALRNLARLDAAGFTLAGELRFQPYDGGLEEWQREALAARPELIQAQQRVELARADIRVAQGRYAPELRARASYDGADPLQGSAVDAWDWSWSAGLSATWRLYDGGLREAEIETKRLELAKSEEDLAELRRTLRLEIENLHVVLRQAAEAVTATEESVGLAEQNLQIAATRYRAGLATHFDYTEAQQSLRGARLARLQALATHARAAAAMDCARGRPVAGLGQAAAGEEE